MNSIYITIALFAFSFCADSTKIMNFDLKKGLNMKGLLNALPKEPDALNLDRINAIINRTNSFPVEDVMEGEIVILETTIGKMKLELFPDKAPNHCRNFKRLANSRFFDGTTFHRIIPGFMIQGGDILSRDFERENDGTGSPGWTIDAEFNDISHNRGILSMARGSDPNSAGSQFFICVGDASHLDGKYTAFGRVIENEYVLDRIVKTPTDYSTTKLMCQSTIPKGEDPELYITLKDPKTNKSLFSKIPPGQQAEIYQREQQTKLYSDNPVSPVFLKKVRVQIPENAQK